MVENGIDITNQDGLDTALGTAKKIGLWTRPYIGFKAKCRNKARDVEKNE